MRRYVQIDGDTDSSVFKIADGVCCSANMNPSDIVAKVYEKGICKESDPIVSVEFNKLDGDEVTFKWSEDIFKLCAGWYILKIENNCRVCGEHTLRIGRDCYSTYLKQVKKTHDNCGEPCDLVECDDRNINYCDCEKECDCVCDKTTTGAKKIITKVVYNHE